MVACVFAGWSLQTLRSQGMNRDVMGSVAGETFHGQASLGLHCVPIL